MVMMLLLLVMVMTVTATMTTLLIPMLMAVGCSACSAGNPSHDSNGTVA